MKEQPATASTSRLIVQLITMEITQLLLTQELLLQQATVHAVDKGLQIIREHRLILTSTEWSRSGDVVTEIPERYSRDKRNPVDPGQHIRPSDHRKRKGKQFIPTNRPDVASTSVVTKSVTTMGRRNTEDVIPQWRAKRYAYEDTHEWPKDDSLDYDFDEKGESEEVTLWQEIADNWQVTIVRGLFILSALLMFLMIMCCCCKIWCRVCCQSMKESCIPCGGFLDILTSFYEDPMYKKAKNLASLLGLKLDYATFIKIKERFELEGTGTYNPLGLPYMQ